MAETNLEISKNVNLQPGAFALPGTYDIPDNAEEVGIAFTRNNWTDTGDNFILEAFLDFSLDGGATWKPENTITIQTTGGVQRDKFGAIITKESSIQTLPDGANRKARVRYNITAALRTTVSIRLITP
jgi:hypothetical protein